jgi:hypothetical protein
MSEEIHDNIYIPVLRPPLGHSNQPADEERHSDGNRGENWKKKKKKIRSKATRHPNCPKQFLRQAYPA